MEAAIYIIIITVLAIAVGTAIYLKGRSDQTVENKDEELQEAKEIVKDFANAPQSDDDFRRIMQTRIDAKPKNNHKP